MRKMREDLTSVFFPEVHNHPNGKHGERQSDVIETAQIKSQLLRVCFEHSTMGFSLTDVEGRLLECNPAYRRITGYSEAELRTHNDPETLTHPEDLAADKERLRALIHGQLPGYVLEKRYFRKSGEILWVETSVSLITNTQGHPERIVRLSRDVTDWKRAENSLHKALTRTEVLLESVSDVYILFDRQWRYLYVNDATVEAMGRPREQILGRTLWELYPDIIDTELERQYRRAMDERVPSHYEYHYPALDTWWENRFKPTADGLAVFATNITERRRVEESLRRSERELADIQQLAALGSWSWDIKTGLMTWSDELYRIFGLHPQEIQASFDAGMQRVHPDDREIVLRAVDQCLVTHERYSQPNRIIAGDGRVRKLQVLGSVITDEQGTPVTMFGLCRDVTELEDSKEAQRTAELKYQSIFENAGEGIFQSTPDGQYLTANPALARIHGFACTDDLIRSCGDISRDIYVDAARRDEFKRLLEKDNAVRDFEHQTFRKDGSKIWISVNARAVRNEFGRILYYEGTTQDITARKETERALRESEERYRELFENSKDPLYVLDMKGAYTSVNRAAEKLTGYAREELIGKDFSTLLTPEYEAHVWGQLSRKLEEPNETIYEAEVLTKERYRIPVEISSRLIFANGVAVGVQGCVRDISERKRALAVARNYSRRVIEAQEAERRRISRELHDQVGQILTALKMNLHSLGRKCSAPEILASIQDNIEVIDEAVDQVRDLSVDLRPLLLDDFGLVVSLRWYLDRQSKSCGTTMRLSVQSISEDDRYSSELETACFRIAQEAVTNVVRHAGAGHILVTLERIDNYLILLICDNGVGFDLSVLSNGAATLGLRGMEERVQAVGGLLTIDSKPSVGTEICARFPIRNVQSRSLSAALCDLSATR